MPEVWLRFCKSVSGKYVVEWGKGLCYSIANLVLECFKLGCIREHKLYQVSIDIVFPSAQLGGNRPMDIDNRDGGAHCVR